jgi:hypothetical protein
MLDLFRTLPGIVDDIEGADGLREAIVFAAWRRIAGDALAEHAAPVGLADSSLSVAVSNVTWQRHLKDLAGQMLFKLNALLGVPTVNYIEFVIDEAAVLAERRGRRPADEGDLRREAENAITPELAAAAEGIADADLRKQFLLAAGNCLVRRARSASRH